MDNAERLSERDRLMLDIAGRVASVDRPTREDGCSNELLAKYPDTEEAYQLALQLYPLADMTRTRPKSAAGDYSRRRAALPSSSHTRNSHGYALLGRALRRAVAEFERMRASRPASRIRYDSLGEAT